MWCECESLNPVADPGFPRGGGANSPGGAPHTKNSGKLHEIKRIRTPGGGGGGASLDPPMELAIEVGHKNPTFYT